MAIVGAVSNKKTQAVAAPKAPAAPAAAPDPLVAEAAASAELDSADVQDLIARCVKARSTAALRTTLSNALTAGKVTVDHDAKPLLESQLAAVKAAKSSDEAAAAASIIGAVGAGIGPLETHRLGVLHELVDTAEKKADKSCPSAREAALLGIAQLSVGLKQGFEPFGLPLLPKLVSLFSDKDKKAADSSIKVVRAMTQSLNPLAVKLLLPALFVGMETTQWRSKEASLQVLALLASKVKHTLGPCLPEAMPKVMECLNDSNAKVQAAASDALPSLIECVKNPETQTLKPMLVAALRTPDKTLDCIDDLLTTTFVNAMDGTSLAFILPVVLRGMREVNYDLVKKSATCAGNMCALVRMPSDIAPFVPLLTVELEKCLEHSSPDVRNAAEKSLAQLKEGAGDLIDFDARARAVGEITAKAIGDKFGRLPHEVDMYLGQLSGALLEHELGMSISPSLVEAAPKQLRAELEPALASIGHSDEEGGRLDSICQASTAAFVERLSDDAKEILANSDGKDYVVDVQKCILAFAGRVLLRQADIRFERGRRYALIGQNGVGKTTLLNRLAAKDINGFPQELNTHYIRHEVVCEDGIDVRTFTKLKAPKGTTDEKVGEVLDFVGFPTHLQTSGVNQLSGGWKMKLSIAISIVHAPSLLLLDEPTNHLDRAAITWLRNHLLSLKDTTIALVCHDYDFVDEVCTDVVHYDNGGVAGRPCKFVYYPVTFSEFQKLKPEIAAGLPTAEKAMATVASVQAANATPEPTPPPSEHTQSEVATSMSRVESVGSSMDKGMSRNGSMASGMESMEERGSTLSKVQDMIASGQILPIVFPDPGKPEGIRTYRKPVIKMDNITFRYPNTERWILTDASVTVTLGSRIVLLGANGAGKSTFLKILVGDLEPTEGQGQVWKHHALRISYMAQQSLHHLEEHLNDTPMHYIQERFRQGQDKELGKLKTLVLTPEEEETMKDVGMVNEVLGRQKRGKQMWYEVMKSGRKKAESQWYPLDEIQKTFKPYVMKLVKNFDMKAQALESGMAIRPITSVEVLAHLADFGIDSALAHGKVKQLSGGQRQRLVLSAAFWSKPHLIALDEPTNYLDNDTLAALTAALKNFKGAVVTVSHNEAFVSEISNEKWIVENGGVTVVQLRDAKSR